MDRLVLVAFLFINWASLCYSADSWSYVKNARDGPSKWKPDVCQSGKKQSPINIKGATYDSSLGGFTRKNYDKKFSVDFTAENDGHGFKVSFPEKQYNVSGGKLSGTYTTVQFHIHWGADNSKGSEHTVNGKQYAAELHFVSYNTKYPNISEALGHSDGLAVLGALIQVGGSDNTAFSFLDICSNLTTAKTTEKIEEFKFDPILPADKTKYFRYNGSLTTPPCSQAVTWTVFKDAVNISEHQINLLRSLNLSDGNPMVDNFRPVLPLNDRTIKSSFKDTEPTKMTTPGGTKKPTTGSASTVKLTAGLLMFFPLAAFFLR